MIIGGTIMMDISQEKALLNQLQSTRRELEHSHDIISAIKEIKKVSTFQADTDGFISRADEVCLQFVGLQGNDVLGEAWINTLHPEDRDTMVTSWGHFIQSVAVRW